MAARQKQNQMTPLSSMGSQSDSPLFWTDKTPPGSRATDIIASLPLKLPSGETYGLSLRGDTLVIAGVNAGISAYKITGSRVVGGVEGTAEGTLISVEASHGIRKILLLTQPEPIPRHAVNHSAVTAPLNLLDEYAELRAKERSHELTRSEQSRKTELLGEIGTEYRRLHREVDNSSYRSTPDTSGESRSGRSSERAG